MLRSHAVQRLLEVEPGTSPELIRYLSALDYPAFATVMCGLPHLGLSFKDDFQLLGVASSA